MKKYSKFILKNSQVVNEGKILEQDILIFNGRIEKIGIGLSSSNAEIIECNGLNLFPGVIDSHVHFREPGFLYKGGIMNESSAAVAGGVTSFMDMPNTRPNTTTIEALENKYSLAKQTSLANYSFYFGITKNNLELASKIDLKNTCGITDDGLYFDNETLLCDKLEALELLFSLYDGHLSLHSENESIIKRNLSMFEEKYKGKVPFNHHHLIRSREACFQATKDVIELCDNSKFKVHFLHISTKEESELILNAKKSNPNLTFETCPQYLLFNSSDYDNLTWRIKWNPAIKCKDDQLYLIDLLKTDKIDFIASDHAPHSLNEKEQNYSKSLSGAPIIQFYLSALIDLAQINNIPLTQVVKKTSHDVADNFGIVDRGYIREGYFADLVLIDLKEPQKINREIILSTCQWSPLGGKILNNKVKTTFVNGEIVYQNGKVFNKYSAMRLQFNRMK